MADEHLSSFCETTPNRGFFDPKEKQNDEKERRKEKKEREKEKDHMTLFLYWLLNCGDFERSIVLKEVKI